MAIINVSAGQSLQAAIDAAKYGDTIKLAAGATYDTPERWVSFNLGDKGTPPTGTDADYITITTDDPAGTPAALFNYPREDVRVTTEMAARMPRVRTMGSLPVFWVNANAKYWKIERLNITNVPGSNTVRLIGLGETSPRSIAEFPDHIIFQQNWIHPAEETGEPLSQANLVRSAENAIYLEGTNITIRQNAIQGFAGKTSDGSRMTSSCHLMGAWANNVLLENNLLEAWTYAVFYGGGSRGIVDPQYAATVSNATATGANFNNVNGLVPGKPIAVGVYPIVQGGENTYYWGTARVKSVSGSWVEYQAPLCNSNNTGGNGNSCRPFDSANVRQTPADGSPARWEGYQVQNVLIRRNIFAHRPEWATFLGTSSGKGYLELKSAHNCTFDGNIFKGTTGPTVTTRNQSGADPWNDLDNLTWTNNWWHNANSPLTAYLNDGGNLTDRSKNYRFVNNLVTGEYAEPDDYNYYRVISNNFSGGDGVTIRHNTILVGSYKGFISSADTDSRVLGVVLEDNIIRTSVNQCYKDPSGTSSALITECWPDAIVRNNVLMKIDSSSTADEIARTWPWPENPLVLSVDAVGFVNPSVTLDASGDYRLKADSPFKGKASDGKDPGCDVDAMMAAIFGDSPPPVIEPPPPPPPPPQPTTRKVAWPTTEGGQNTVVAEQWRDRYRFKRNLTGKFAEFELVP